MSAAELFKYKFVEVCYSVQQGFGFVLVHFFIEQMCSIKTLRYMVFSLITDIAVAAAFTLVPHGL